MAYDWSFLENGQSSAQSSGSVLESLQAADPKWEFALGDRLESNVQQSFGLIWNALGAAADAVGLEKAGDWAEERSAQLMQKAAEKQIVETDFSGIENPVDAGKWAYEVAVGFLPDLGMMLLGGAGAGTLAAKVGAKGYGNILAKNFMHKTMASNLKKEAAKSGAEKLTKDQLYKNALSKTMGDTGRMIGVAGYEGLIGTGQAYKHDLETRGEEASPAAAFGAGAAQMGIAILNPLNKLFAGRLPKGKTSVGLMTISEAAEETGQEVISMAHEAGIDPNVTLGSLLNSEEGAMRLIESGLAGALMGGAVSGGVKVARGEFIKEKTSQTPTDLTEATKKAIEETPEEVLKTKGIDTSQDSKNPMETKGSEIASLLAERKAASRAKNQQSLIERGEAAKAQSAKVKATVAPEETVTQKASMAMTGPRSIPVGQALPEVTAPEPTAPPAEPKTIRPSVMVEYDKQRSLDGKPITPTRAFSQTIRDKELAATTTEAIEELEVAKTEEIKAEIKNVVPTTPTNLKKRNEVNKQIVEAKKEIVQKKEELKDTPLESTSDAIPSVRSPKTISEVNEQERISKRREAKRKEIQSNKDKAEKESLLKERENVLKTAETDTRGFTAKVATVDGKSIETREKTLEDGSKVVVIKDGAQYFVYKAEEKGPRKKIGVSKKLGEAQDLAEGLIAPKEKKVGRPKREVSVEDISEENANELFKVKDGKTTFDKLREYAEKRISNTGIEVDPTKIDEAIIRGAVDFKAGGNKDLFGYTKTKIEGALKDWTKGKAEVQETLTEDGKGSIENTSSEEALGEVQLEERDTHKPKEYTISVTNADGQNVSLTKIGTSGEYTDPEGKTYGSAKSAAVEKYNKENLPKIKKVELSEEEKKAILDRMQKDRKSPNSLKDNSNIEDFEGISPQTGSPVELEKSTRHKNAFELLSSVEGESTNKSDITTGLTKFLLSNLAVRNRLKKIPVYISNNGKSYFSAKKGDKVGRLVVATQKGDVWLHEAVHGLTSIELAKGGSFSKEIESLMDVVRSRLREAGVFTQDQLDSMSSESYDEYQRKRNLDDEYKGNEDVAYALRNNREFLAQAFSSESFQKLLKTIKTEAPKGSYRGGKFRDVWNKFVSLVRNVLGISKKHYTALDRLITVVPEIAQKVETESTKSGGTTYDYSNSKVGKVEDWDARAKVMAEASSSTGLLDAATKGIKKLGRETLKSTSEVLRKIDPKLVGHLRRFESRIYEDNVKSRREIKPFVDKYKELSKDDKNLLDLTLMNNTEEDIKKRNQILRDNNMLEEYAKVEKLLKDIYDRREKLGLNEYGEKEGYFPRRVRDMDSLMKDLYDDPEFSVIQAELFGMKSPEEREAAVKKMLSTGRMPAIALIKGASGNKRTISRVSSKWKKHYEETPTALLGHIYENSELLSAHEMFADSAARRKAIKERDSAYKILEDKKAKEEKKLEAAVRLEAAENFLKDPERQYEGLDQFLVKEAPGLSSEDTRVVLNAIRARLNQKGMSGPLATFRNISLMSALGSPTSAITQIGDLAFSIYKNGPKDTIKAMFGPRVISAKDLDLEHSMKEFQTEGSAKWLDHVLTWSGLKTMDMFGKNVSINASLNKAKGQTLEEFSRDWRHVFGDKVEKIHNDIKEDKNNQDTRFFVFNDLSNWQPISLSEMPQKYLEAGNGRIFYALKSYNIKAINNIYRELVHKWRVADSNTERAEAAKNAGKLIFLMTIAGATADELKDFLLGRSADTFEDNVYENLLKIAFMSRYTLDQGFGKGFFETFMKDVLMPPIGFIDEPMADIYNTFSGDPSWKSIQNLPWGKLPYDWFSEDAEQREYKKIRDRIYDSIVKDGDKMNTIRKDMHRYNKWAREYNRSNKKDKDKTLITYKGLMVAKRRYEKESRSN